MPAPGPFSLDQLHVFLTVVNAGSFAAAARHLGRAHSAISYAIDTLETNLGLALFDRRSTRRPSLTPAGEAVLREARAVTHGAEMLRSRVGGLLEGVEAEVSLAVDEMFPPERIVPVLRDFMERFPTVPIRLHSHVLGGVERAVTSGDCCIGIGGTVHIVGDRLTRYDIDGVLLIPVAAANHPLARSSVAEAGESRESLQVVLTDGPIAVGPDYGIVGARIWRVGSLHAKYQLLLGGIGWGGLPEPMVRDDVAAGRLVALDIPEWRGAIYVMQTIHRNDARPGPAGHWLMSRLADRPIYTPADTPPP
jgi:DNA-binding transcriptional LysR family regulator